MTSAQSEPPPLVEFEVDGVTFALRVFDDPSGLRGQVFLGEEKIAGVQIFHDKDVARLTRSAIRDRAVLRAVQQVKNTA